MQGICGNGMGTSDVGGYGAPMGGATASGSDMQGIGNLMYANPRAASSAGARLRPFVIWPERWERQ